MKILKNRNFIALFILAAVIILSANTGLCVDDIAQHVPAVDEAQSGVSLTMSKFVVTMIGVIVSSIVIWGGLSVYNKFFVKYNSGNPPLRKTFNTPKNLEDAVTFFIKRNKLR